MEKKAGVLSHLPSRVREWRLSAKKLRKAGDAARDAKDWREASDTYRRYLNLVDDDTPIWIQYGHALKESGLLVEAESAYRKAVTLDPADLDARVHLAYLLKRMSRPSDARAEFVEVIQIEPSAKNIQELQNITTGLIGNESLFVRPPYVPPNAVFFELKDLFQYLSSHVTVTGITRVTLGIVNYVLRYMDEERAKNYFFVHQFRDAEGVILISHNNMRRIVKAALSSEQDLAKMQDLLTLIKATSPIFLLGSGDTYVILGAFWEFVASPSWIGGMRNRGVKIGTYIYDLIPITHHQYCVKELTEAFTVAFAETAQLMDFALTISSFVAKDVTEFLQRNQINPLPTLPVPLAHELRFEGEKLRENTSKILPDPLGVHSTVRPASQKQYLEGIPFVLCVCTIEARKNHVYLFQIWKKMIDARIDVPDLVFVGRPGWQVSELLEQIEQSRHLDGRLHILNGLTDDELAGLYDRCLFTAFPSFVEGWGLPVGESLAHGKVCVASTTSSIPEVGGDFVIYADPFDIEAGYQTISKLILEPAYLQSLQERIRTQFAPRTWKDVGEDFFNKLDQLNHLAKQPEKGRPIFAPLLRSNQTFDVRNMGKVGKLGADYVRNPVRLIFVEGWRAVETTGTWMLGSTAKLRVRTDLLPGERVVVLIEISTSPWVGPQNTLVVYASHDASVQSGHRYNRPMQQDKELWLTIHGEVDEKSCLTIHFEVKGLVQVTSLDAIAVSLRFRQISYARLNDLPARLNLMEHALLAPGSALLPSESSPRS